LSAIIVQVATGVVSEGMTSRIGKNILGRPVS
jgi:hypothetical protein